MRYAFRHLTLAMLASAALVAAQPAAAQAPAPAANNSIVVLNIQEIMRDSSAGKSIKDQLDKKQKSFQSELSGKEESLQKENQELAKQRGVLAKEAFDQKVKEFNTKASEVQKDVQGKKIQLDRAFNNSVNEIQKSVNGILEEMAKEKGFTVVVPTQQTLYAASSLDITKEVLERLNKKLPSVTVNFNAAAPKADAKGDKAETKPEAKDAAKP